MIKKPEYFILCVTPLILMIGLIGVIMMILGVDPQDTKLSSFGKAVFSILRLSRLLHDFSEEEGKIK
jgi:hypothetical protein